MIKEALPLKYFMVRRPTSLSCRLLPDLEVQLAQENEILCPGCHRAHHMKSGDTVECECSLVLSRSKTVLGIMGEPPEEEDTAA